MARKTNKTTSTQQAPAKVAKRTRKAASGQQAKASEQAAPRKGRKAKAEQATASGQQARRRSQYAGMSIKVTPEGKKATPRGNAGVLFDVISAAKKVDDVIGAPYTRVGGKYDGETWTVQAVDITYLINRGLIESSNPAHPERNPRPTGRGF